MKNKIKNLGENVFFNAYIILEDNQILDKTFVSYFFYFLKRVLNPLVPDVD